MSAEEYLKLLENAKRRRSVISGRTKRRVSDLQWRLGEHHGSDNFFAETHVQTNVPLTGGYVEVIARVNETNLERIFDAIMDKLDRMDPEGRLSAHGDPNILHMVIEGENGGQVHVTYVPTGSGETHTQLSIKGFGHTGDVARIFKIIAEALKELHRQGTEALAYEAGERESMG